MLSRQALNGAAMDHLASQIEQVTETLATKSRDKEMPADELKAINRLKLATNDLAARIDLLVARNADLKRSRQQRRLR